MKDSRQELNESLKKIQGLMYYDKSLTATENEEIIEEQLGAGLAMLGGKRVVDKSRQNRGVPVKPREVDVIVRRLHKNLEGRKLMTDRGEMRNALYQIKHLTGRAMEDGSDPVDVIKTEYERRYGVDLIGDIESKSENLDFRGSQFQKQLVDLLGGAGVESAVEPEARSTSSSGGYVPCQAGINKVGCKSDSIAQVQQAAGLKPDGMFGPKTQAKLDQVAPEFSKQFTDADVPTIQAKLKTERIPAPSKIDLSKMANPGLTTIPQTRLDPAMNQLKNPTFTAQAPAPSKRDQRLQGRVDKLQQKLGEDEIEVKEDMFEKPEIKPGGAKMTQGFMNESLSNKEQWRKNKQERLDRKLGRV